MTLDRFTEAQEKCWPRALAEIRAGRKDSHWMWFIFPQLRGLGHSPNAEIYGLADLDEARRFLAHPTLGPRLLDIAAALLAHRGRRPESILGPVDAMKLRSCATLFEAAGAGIFTDILDTFHDGTRCEVTLRMLARRD